MYMYNSVNCYALCVCVSFLFNITFSNYFSRIIMFNIENDSYQAVQSNTFFMFFFCEMIFFSLMWLYMMLKLYVALIYSKQQLDFFLKYVSCPGKLQFASSQASLVFKKSFADAVSS